MFNELEDAINYAIEDIEGKIAGSAIKDVKVTDVHDSHYLCAIITYTVK